MDKYNKIGLLKSHRYDIDKIIFIKINVEIYGRYKLRCTIKAIVSDKIIKQIRELENECKYLIKDSLYVMNQLKSTIDNNTIYLIINQESSRQNDLNNYLGEYFYHSKFMSVDKFEWEKSKRFIKINKPLFNISMCFNSIYIENSVGVLTQCVTKMIA